MFDLNFLIERGFSLVEEFVFDEDHLSYVFEKNKLCLIVDVDLCLLLDDELPFDYTRYCDMQNSYMMKYNTMYRFNFTSDSTYDEITSWLKLDANELNITDDGGHFSETHVDNTPIELDFENIFKNTYGDDALVFLKKEYSVSLNDGHVGFADYVIETKNGNVAFEANGVNYHHPQKLGNEKYHKQLEKQNTLNLMGFKLYRFSTNNIMFKEQVSDNLKTYLGSKDNFINSTVFKDTRKIKLYDHQENILEEINAEREKGVNTSLIVIPTATGKSQIVIEDLKNLTSRNLVKNVLIMVPSLRIKVDWEERVKIFSKSVNIEVKTYTKVYIDMRQQESSEYDYICFDEAHHAAAATARKVIQYFNPTYLIGLTATPDRLDKKKLEEIFGTYNTKLSLKEAIDKDIIADVCCYRLESNLDLSKIRFNGTDYNYSDLEKNLIIDSRNNLIVETLKKYFYPTKDFFKQGIIFCVNVKHAEKIAKMMRDAGFNAEAVYGGKDNSKAFKKYENKEIQFLASCQLISEGWDSPQTEVVVMARPTLSKVLYTQQLGRGLRKYPGKDCLYCIDVVDNYSSKLTPICFNSIFKIPLYKPFETIKGKIPEYLEINGLYEYEVALKEIDIFSFDEKYGDYLSTEQAARELYVGTNTLASWTRKDKELASLYLPIGNKLLPYYSNDDINNIRIKKKLKVHTDETILEDFLDFIDENTLTFSFKLIYMIYMIKLANDSGEVVIDEILEKYCSFYKNRLDHNLPVDKKNCIYDYEMLKDKVKMKRSLLENPFEKFERKRFVYQCKDLNILAFNPNLWTKLTKEIKDDLLNKLFNNLKDYYEDKGGLIEQDINLL